VGVGVQGVGMDLKGKKGISIYGKENKIDELELAALAPES